MLHQTTPFHAQISTPIDNLISDEPNELSTNLTWNISLK